MNTHNWGPVIMVSGLVLGLMLIVIAGMINNQQSKACISSKIRSANLTVMAVGVGILVATVGYFVCRLTCEKLGEATVPLNAYMGLMMSFGVTLTVCGSMIVSDSDSTFCPVKSQGGLVVALGVLLTVFPAAYLGYKLYSSAKH